MNACKEMIFDHGLGCCCSGGLRGEVVSWGEVRGGWEEACYLDTELN